MSNLLSELDAQSKWLRKVAAEIATYGYNGWGNTCLQAADAIDTHHAEIAAAVRDAEALRDMLRNTVAIAVTQLFATNAADVVAAFTLADLQRISELSEPLADANVSVEDIYREAWDAAMSAREGA